jgi:hypothetical protein
LRTKTLLLAALIVAPLAARSQVAADGPAAQAGPDLRAPPPTPEAGAAAATAPPAAEAGVTAAAAPKRKHGIFPLWGDAVRAKGFDLPEPFGFMVNYYFQKSDIQIANLKLGLNDGPLRDATFIEIPDARTKASALSIRPSLMVLPFLSVYAVFSSGATETNVHIASPVDFSTEAKSGAQVLSLGTTFQMGYKGFFGVADFNASVSDVERLADAVGANMLSFRLGYNHRFGPEGRGVAFWGGTAGQVIDVETTGSVKLAEVLRPPNQATVDAAQARCDALRPVDPRKQVCNELVQAMQGWANGTAPPDTSVSYSLDKKPAHVWNVVAGAQFALDRHWQFRVETSFLNGRVSLLAGPEYRFDIL